MNLSVILDTIISVIAVVILLSIICSTLFELIGRFTRNRSKVLWGAIEKALYDPGLAKNYADLLYAHPQIQSMHRTTLDKPSYLSPEVFANTLVYVVIKEYEKDHLVYDWKKKKYLLPQNIVNQNDLQRFYSAVSALEFTQFGELVKSFTSSTSSLDEVKANMVKWYNGYMDRVAGWYKRKTQKWLLLIGLIIAISLNADLIQISKRIYSDATIRKDLVPLAESLGKQEAWDPSDKTNKEIIDDLKNNYSTLKNSGIPMGWSEDIDDNFPGGFWLSLLGWILTALVVSRGAPFWFSVLKSVLNLRSTGRSNYKNSEK